MDKTISALILSLFAGIMIFGMINIVSAVNGSDASENSAGCKNLYYIDNTNKDCSQKQFCGMYMYQGLQTFEIKGECEDAADGTNCAKEGEVCYGFAGLPCCGNLECDNLDSTKPDVGGICKRKTCVGDSCGPKTCPENSENENGTCKFTLSNGRKAEIKIMPETASATAIAKLGDLGFTIELKEVGQNRTAYELTGNKEGRFLGIFKIMARETIQVDAENGEVIKVIKPWWAFLATRI